MKKMKKTFACLLVAMLIFSTVPMSVLADEVVAPVIVTDAITAVESEEAATPDAKPSAEPKPESTAEPTVTPEASTKPSAEPTAEPTPGVTEEPAEPETSAEPEATAEPTASPTPNPEDEISLLALGDEAITRYRTVGINGNFSSNYLYDLGEFPLYDIYRNGVSYPAYCLQHGKGRVNNGAYVQRDNYGMTEAMRRIIAYGYNTTNSLGKNDWYSDATAKTMVTQYLVWLAENGTISVNNNTWTWNSAVDADAERMANLAYNGSVVRSYYAELKDRLLRSEILPSFAGKNSDGSDAQEIDLQLVNGKYTATVTDTNGVLDLFDFQQAGFDISRSGNKLTISASTLPTSEITIIGASYTTGDANSIAVWEDKDKQSNIQHQATCPGSTQVRAYIKIKGKAPTYTVTLTKTSADLKVTNGNSNYSLEGAVYNVYKAYVNPAHDYTNDPVIATFTTDANGKATLSRKLENGDYVTIEQVAPLGYTLDKNVHRFSINGKSANLDVVDDPTKIRLTVRKKDADTNSNVPQGDATLEGAQYRITYTNNDEKIENIVTTNKSGQAVLRNIPIGVLVTVEEIGVPLGYKLDSKVHTYITTTDTKELEYDLIPEDFTEEVMKGQIALHKQYETLDEPADEQGAEFDVYLKSAGSFDAAKETERDHITTGADGMATTKDLPYGTYVVHQSKGGNGRQLVEDFDVVISEDGKVYSYDLVNIQKNAQFKIVKTSEDGVIEGIKFRVTRLEDNYSAEYVTNAAGEILTETLPIYADKDGATKYQYKVEELDTEETFGYQLPDSQTVELSEGEIASVSFHNKPIEIGTKATVDGEKEVDPLDKVTLTDTVSYTGLVPGKEYKVTGVLMDKETGEKLLVDGKEITAETVFVPETKNGSVDVTFIFDATGLHGKEVVVFEDLYRENIKVAAHADITDDDQTIKVKTPEIGTKATADGKKKITADKITITDVVSYTDLTPGKEYKLTGVLMNKATNDKLLIDGKEITAEATFTPKATTGEVEMTFTFDARELTAETEVVVFETLYRDGIEIAVHADIEDEGQTVKILPLHGSIMTTKVNADDPTDKISGATFGVYSDADGDGIFNAKTDKLVGTLQEGDTGVYTLDSLPYGKFFLHENKAPEGFVQENIYYPFEIKEDGQIVNFETVPGKDFPNKPIKGTVTTTKVDATNPQHKLSGAVFEIYRDADGDGRYTEGVDTLIGRMDEIETGFYSLSDLVYGKYLIYEAQAPANFVRDTIYYPFSITEDGQTVTFETIPGKDFPNSPVPNRPKTGSSRSVLPYIAFAGSALGLTTVLLVRRKKSR